VALIQHGKQPHRLPRRSRGEGDKGEAARPLLVEQVYAEAASPKIARGGEGDEEVSMGWLTLGLEREAERGTGQG